MRMRRGFTLVELMVTIAIIAILAGMLLGALYVSQEQAKEARTRSLIQRLDQSVMARYESYRTRRLPLGANDLADRAASLGLDPADHRDLARVKLAAMRELIRMELPDRWSDVVEDPMILRTGAGAGVAIRPAISNAYLRVYTDAGAPDPGSDNYQGAECLYLIISMAVIDDDPLAQDSFGGRDVGDVDGDGLKEFLDGWRQPISFLRWAPGFISEVQPDPTVPDVVTFARDHHDPFDNLRLDMPAAGGPPRGFQLKPLVFAPGPDGALDIWRNNSAGLSADDRNDPYYLPADRPLTGTPMTPDLDPPADGESQHEDNLHNHVLETRLQ